MADGVEQTDDAPRSRFVALAIVGVVVVLVAAGLVVGLRDSLEGRLISVEVPVGTMARIEDGAAIELLPRTLQVDVGDTLEVVNRDDAVHEVGPYTVGPGETVRQTFTATGTIEGVCTLHPDGEITIVVT